MAPIHWGIVSAGLISSDFVNAIHSLKDHHSHQVSLHIQYIGTCLTK